MPEQLDQLTHERALLQQSLPGVVRHVIDGDVLIESRIESLQRLLDEAQVERTRQREVMYQITKLQREVHWIDHGNETLKIDMATELVSKWYDRKNEFPKTSEMTQAQRSLIKQVGGLKHVVEMVRKRQRTDAS